MKLYLKQNAVFMLVFLVKEVEISDTLPLMAFGCSIPYVEPRYDVEVTRFVSLLPLMGYCSEFELPWFNLDERDAKETIRTTRSRARASKTGSVSSPPSANSAATT